MRTTWIATGHSGLTVYKVLLFLAMGPLPVVGQKPSCRGLQDNFLEELAPQPRLSDSLLEPISRWVHGLEVVDSTKWSGRQGSPFAALVLMSQQFPKAMPWALATIVTDRVTYSASQAVEAAEVYRQLFGDNPVPMLSVMELTDRAWLALDALNAGLTEAQQSRIASTHAIPVGFLRS